MVGLRVRAGQAHVLVEEEGLRLGEAQPAGPVPLDQLPVGAQGSGAGGQSQDGRAAADLLLDGVGGGAGHVVGGGKDDDFHAV